MLLAQKITHCGDVCTVPAALLEFLSQAGIGHGIDDWRNHIAPCVEFSAAPYHLQIWINPDRPERREFDGMSRYVLSCYRADGEYVSDLIETDCEDELLEMVRRIGG